MKTIKLKNRNGDIIIGDNNPIIVNCNVGINEERNYVEEIKKIDSLFEKANTTPDTMMDLSICEKNPSIAKYIIDKYKIPVGLVPIYTIFSKQNGVSKEQLIECIVKNAEDGVSFMTMHFTADKDILHIAKKDREIPTTSRGGAVTLADMRINKRPNNIFIENIDEIISLSIKYNFVISIGATFRPAGIRDACDEAHITETNRQKEVCDYIQKRGANVLVENVGHIDVNKIAAHSKLLREMNAPIMPLGPIPIDSAMGDDHIAAAIGAAFMGYFKCAHIINAITPSEHLTSTFTATDLQCAVSAAKIAADSINICNHSYSQIQNTDVYQKRALNKSCLSSIGENKCSRCDLLCPLKIEL